MNLPALAHGLEGAGHRARTTHLHNLVDTTAVCKLPYLGIPVWRRFVVDGLVGPQSSAAFELFIRRAGKDDSCAVRFGDLQPKEGDAAGSLDQHRFAGTQVALLHKGVPGRERGAGQGGRLLKGERVRDADHAVRGKDAIRGKDTIDRTAERRFANGLRDLAIGPFLKKQTGHAITGLPFSHTLANRRDLTCSIGTGDTRQRHLWVVLAEHNHQVAIIQRGRVKAYMHLSRSRCRNLPLKNCNFVESEGRELKILCSHKLLDALQIVGCPANPRVSLPAGRLTPKSLGGIHCHIVV